MVVDTFIFVLLILAIVFGSRIVRDYLRYDVASNAAAPSDDTRLLAEEIARLRERVQVLERVVTDNHGSLDLDRRIDALRDH